MVVGLAGALGCSGAASAEAASQRFASVTGTGVACSSASPCSLTQAIAGAASGDEVIVDPGTYVPAGGVVVNVPNLDIHGVAGQPRPVILFGADGLQFSGSAGGGTVRHLEVDQVGGTSVIDLGVGFGGTVDDVIARGSANGGNSCFFRDVIVTNTICTSTGAGAAAVLVQANLAATSMTFRNVTAVSTGASSIGIDLQGISGHGLNSALVNTIAQGTSTGLVVFTDSTSSVSSVAHVSYSDVSTHMTMGTGAVIDDQGHNLTTPATYANVAGGDLHELASSVTVDHGVDDPANGAADLDGNPRSLGPATDIGAYELPEAPMATTSAATSVHASDAQLNAQVNPEGLPTTVSFQYGTSNAYGASTASQSAGSGLTGQPITAVLPGLAPMTTYHYRVVATSAAGSMSGGDMTFTTSASQSGGGPHLRPVLSAFAISPRTFALAGRRVNGRCVPATRANHTHRRCTRSIKLRITYQLDIPARVTITLTRALPGRRVRGHCVTPTRINRHHPACTRLTAVHGALTGPGNQGANRLAFNGQIGKSKLTPGSYRLTATPTANGGAGAPHTIALTITR